jgi:hypothetical protein
MKSLILGFRETVNDATGENAIGSGLKKENFRDREN